MEKFTLKKFSEPKSFEYVCKYNLTDENDEGIKSREFTQTNSDALPLPLIDLFGKLGALSAQLLGTDVAKTQCTGITLTGKGEKRGIAMEGSVKYGTYPMKFKLPKIKYLQGQSKMHAELTVIMKDLEVQVRDYVLNGSNAQVEVFGENTNK